ncbi:MAG: MmcQ/YjbR family DNA-binding protein [Bacteroidales bacterium]
MNLEEVREYCLGKKGVTEGFPFDESTLVFKVGGKMFALLNLENPHSVNLKCDPEKAVILREQYPAVLPGYHMNKKYWNTVMLDGSIPPGLIREWIDHSWDEVVKSLPLYRQKDLWNK